ncbi:FKBP-type peptidyl-prolyl cis-trans isomerase [Alteraurantiacibacter buctensis]|uniref:Peptidyl-prolyl cis-trans isomerase n=1 Tax=Alteraurantiacibacter buctensis TaxID=1503981 RepID=A0A844Z1X3_9SPHN|nr:FKBP-type peptidyl-prolyl cis-trans isomerase [Alteraurantiacibacter buctensis]MXO72684.1 FKBP-type peptidyl-prolyl cis-trans isomerase [Alteraurantiacibacter buctensis]
MRKFIAVLTAFAGATPAMAQEARDITQDSAWANDQLSALYALTPEDGWYVLDGGVRMRRTAGDGTGPAPTVRDTVTVNYTGRLTTGEVFDSTRGRRPATFPLGQLVRAWQVAIPYMGIGDTIEIAVPAEMGYGARGAGPIPPNATLFFEIELLDVMVAPGR